VVQLTSLADEQHGQLVIDLPGTAGVCISECAQRYLRSDAHMVTLRTKSIKSGSKVPQTLPEGELTKTQTEQVIPARKVAYPIITVVAGNYFSKLIFRNNVHELGENDPASVHVYIYY